MRQVISYQELAFIEEDMSRGIGSSPAFKYLMGPKIQLFYNNNRRHLVAIQEKMKALAEEYVKKNETGQFSVQKLENGGVEWDFKSPEDRDKYAAEYKEFMEKQIEIFN